MDTDTSTEAPGIAGLYFNHLQHLRASGLSDDMIRAAGIYTVKERDKAAVLLDWKKLPKRILPAIVFPYNGSGYVRLRPDTPRKIKERSVKYEAPRGQRQRPYFPPGVTELLPNVKQELIATEGEKKALKATQDGFPCIGLSGVDAWCDKGSESLCIELDQIDVRGRLLYIAFDSDITSKPQVQDAERRLAKQLTDKGAIVRCVRLPDGPDGAKQGVDDYLVAHGPGPFRKLLDEAIEPEPVDAGELKQDASKLDPAEEAGSFLERLKIDGACRLQFWCGSFWLWEAGRYVEKQNPEVRAYSVRHLNEHFRRVGTSPVSDVMEQIRAQSVLPSSYVPPCWIGDAAADFKAWDGRDLLGLKNGIIHLPTLVSGGDFQRPATPSLFTTAALDYQFSTDAPPCTQWLAFLNDLWRGDLDSINTLQEWFGYCLTPDTRHQKILMLIGPRRSGKGTIARVLRSVVGEMNVAGPTLASLATNFGLWPLLGKSVAIINDARLSGRTDQAVVVERLLSISGEDALTVDRKNLVPITTKLQVRFAIVSNELPRLTDSSGALSGRMIVLRLTETFYGREDLALSEKLTEERPGILLWAIEGWRRLRERGRFHPPASSAELREQLEDLASPISAFIRERCFVGAEHRASVDDLYDAWKHWCDESGREPGNVQTFGRDLVAACHGVRRVRPREEGERHRAYDGIGLKRF